jgi:uncharacterized protein YjlB
MPANPAEVKVDALFFEDDGKVPNNPRLPLLVYHDALAPDAVSPEACEALFAANDWSGGWRNGIFAQHHYHPDAHEVLGIVRGRARVLFGGPNGRMVEVAAGDVAVLPAGTGHKREDASADLLVIGAYPGSMDYDTIFADSAAHDRAVVSIARVPLPVRDPVFGDAGPLLARWLKG